MDSSVKIQILDVLNNLEVIEQNGGDFPYLLVSNNEETQEKLSELGVLKEKLISSGDEETFCILVLAFNEGYANDYKNGKLVYETDKYAVYNSTTNETKTFDLYIEAYNKYKELKEENKTEKVFFFETIQFSYKKNDNWEEKKYQFE